MYGGVHPLPEGAGEELSWPPTLPRRAGTHVPNSLGLGRGEGLEIGDVRAPPASPAPPGMHSDLKGL